MSKTTSSAATPEPGRRAAAGRGPDSSPGAPRRVARRTGADGDDQDPDAEPGLVGAWFANLSPRGREVVALGLCVVALYALLCLATFRRAGVDLPIPSGDLQNLGGAFGYYLAAGFVRTLGLAGWVPFLLLFAGALALFLGRRIERLVLKVLGGVVFAAMLAILLAGSDGRAGYHDMTPWGGGGVFGAVVSPRLEDGFGGPGRLLIVGFCSLLSLLMATQWLFSDLLLRGVAAVERLWLRVRGQPQPATATAGAAVPAADADAAPKPRRRRRAAAAADDDGVAAAMADELSLDEDPSDTGSELVAAAGADPAASVVAPDEGDDDPAAAGEADGPRRRRRRRAGERSTAAADEVGPADAAEPADPTGSAEAEDAEPAPESDADEAAAAAPAADAVEPAAPKRPIVVLRARPKPARPKAPKRTQSTLPFDEEYPFPPVELFAEAQHDDLGESNEVLVKGGEAIVAKLASFNMKCEVVAASIGPAVTQYELRLDDGIRVNKITGFEADLAAALKAVSVRVVAPIPGKDTVGVEVPNGSRQKVFMRDLLDQFGRSEDKAIPLYLGKDVAGNPIVEDLARMPHLLIAGTTGSGKSVCINTILLSILMTRAPRQVQMILVDPKMVELQMYKNVPHLCCDVVTNMKKAPAVLQWAVDEMENRYALLSAAGVNHIKNYNRLGEQELKKRLQKDPAPDRIELPYIVIVIDEFADLMNVAQNEVEESIQRLAQKSRAVGMHVILATQRPSSEVITGIIKANLPCQIAFKVNRRIDSRVILDANGAEKLLGHGDMLYMPPGGAALLRAQGTFVADEELGGVVKFLEEHGQRPNFNPALVQTQSSSRSDVASRDELYPKAVEVILGQQRGSATLIQRALGVGYTRATRLLELMEEDGLVGPFVGAKAREVLMTLEEYQARELAMAEELEALAAEGEGAEASEADDEEPPFAVDDAADAESAVAGPADEDGPDPAGEDEATDDDDDEPAETAPSARTGG